jgi:hypothetical protein
MKRVYLDQNKWIDLAAASKGLAKGRRFADPLTLLQAMVDRGDVSLPLSAAHYMETHNRRSYRSRRDLAATMVSLSRMQTIAPSSSLLPGELDRALRAMCGRPQEVRELKPFGRGASHAFGFPVAIDPTVAEIVARRPDLVGAERGLARFAEVVLLAGLPPEEEAEIEDYEPFAHLEVAERNATEKQKLRELRRTEGWNKGEKAERVAKTQALFEYLEPVQEALARALIPFDDFIDLGEEQITAFLESVPSLHAALELERLRETASQKPWERQDLNDLGALSVAAVYCDFVVTERLWVDLARRAKLGDRFDTVFISDLAALPPLLV